jgi:hypothetical protein
VLSFWSFLQTADKVINLKAHGVLKIIPTLLQHSQESTNTRIQLTRSFWSGSYWIHQCPLLLLLPPHPLPHDKMLFMQTAKFSNASVPLLFLSFFLFLKQGLIL